MRVGPYEVQSELGRGGTGAVYRVLAPNGQSYALKRISTTSSGDDQVRLQRIARELQALQRIDHPGVVRAFDSGWDAGAFYIVMELIEGPSLGSLIEQQGPLAPDVAAEMCASLARTLHHLHQLGIVHRDVKPDNVLLQDGRPRLTDLGLVRLKGNDQLTKTGTMVGTPGYCAPELLASTRGTGRGPTPAADVYGVGATLFALLTGHPPFEGDSHIEVAVRTVDRPATPPSKRVSGLTSSEVAEIARLDAICLQCLAKDPGDRYVSALELARDLEAAFEGDLVPAGGRPVGLVLTGLLAVLLLASGAAVTLRGSGAAETQGADASSAQPSGTPPTPLDAPGAPSPTPRQQPSPTPTPSPTTPPVSPPTSPPTSSPQRPPKTIRVWRKEVQSVADLAPMGRLARATWRGRRSGWILGRAPDGFVTLRSTKASNTISHLHLRNSAPKGPLTASVVVGLLKGQAVEGAGLLYGRIDEKSYLLLGITSRGRRFVKLRTPRGLTDRLSGALPPGPRRFGVRETPRGLEVQFDGKRRMVLGGGVQPGAVVGVFVIGGGAAKFRDFELEW